MPIRVASYNIHKCIGGVDRRYQPERIIDVLRHYSPDIVLLQEVDDGVPRSRRERQISLLAEALCYEHLAFQANVTLKEGVYGNGILSRYPIRETHHVDLTIPFKKRRQALMVKLHLSSTSRHHTLGVICTHLGLASFERRLQLRRLLTYPPLHRIHHDTPVVLGGDLNDVWLNLERKLLKPAGYTAAAGRLPTFPAFAPVRALDAIYWRGSLTVQSAFVGHTQLVTQASDHRPLVVDFEVDPD